MKLNLKKPLVVFDLETTGLDLVKDRIIQISYIKVYPDREEYVDRHELGEKTLSITDIQKEELEDVFAHELAVRTSILRDNQIKMTEHCFYVDMELVFFSLLYSRTAAKLDTPVYRYRLGVVGQSASIQGRIKHWQDAERVEKRLLDAYAKHEAQLASPLKEILFEMVSRFAVYQYQNYVLMKGNKEARNRALAFDAYLKTYPELYQESGKSRLVSLLRRMGFRCMRPLYNYVSRVAL